MMTAASSGSTCHSSSSHSFSSRNAARHASARDIPDTIVVRWVLVLTLGACMDAGLAAGVADAVILVPHSGEQVTSPAPIAALQSPKYSNPPAASTGRMTVAPLVIALQSMFPP